MKKRKTYNESVESPPSKAPKKDVSLPGWEEKVCWMDSKKLYEVLVQWTIYCGLFTSCWLLDQIYTKQLVWSRTRFVNTLSMSTNFILTKSGPSESCYGWTVYVDLNPHSQFGMCLPKLKDAACSEAPVCVAQLPKKSPHAPTGTVPVVSGYSSVMKSLLGQCNSPIFKTIIRLTVSSPNTLN